VAGRGPGPEAEAALGRRPGGRLPWHRWPAGVVPLRIDAGRFWLWAVALTVIGAVITVGAPANGFIDYPQFWAAGRTVGTPDLLDPARHAAWQAANGLREGFFAYPPGAAWLFAPFAVFPLAAGFWLNAATALALTAASGVLGARLYGLDRRVGLVAALAWAPCLASAALGQNAVLALFLALTCVDGLRRRNELEAGLAVGLLLYKPTVAAPLLGLMLLRGHWRGLAIAAAAAAGWYLAGVAATAGDWGWPGPWLDGLNAYYAVDTPGNAGKAISLPGVLAGHGLATPIALGLGALLVAAAIPRLIRAPLLEAAAGACVVGLAASAHSLNYEAALVLPAILWAISERGIAEPVRTRLLVPAYLLAPLYFVSPTIGWSVLQPIVLIAAAVWISGAWRLPATRAEGATLAQESSPRR
jgi:hypothetical protein